MADWIKITDDTATFPPIGEPVFVVNEYKEVKILAYDGRLIHARHQWRSPTKMHLGHYPDHDKVEIVGYKLISEDVKEWKRL